MRLRRHVIVFVALPLLGACGGGESDGASRFTASDAAESTPTEPGTVWRQGPDGNIAPVEPMTIWRQDHIGDLDPIRAALQKLSDTAEAGATPAGYAQVCVEFGDAVRLARLNLPAPDPRFNALYTEALSSYSAAAHSCGNTLTPEFMGAITDATAFVTAAVEALSS